MTDGQPRRYGLGGGWGLGILAIIIVLIIISWGWGRGAGWGIGGHNRIADIPRASSNSPNGPATPAGAAVPAPGTNGKPIH